VRAEAERRVLVEAVRDACLEAARRAYEEAGMSGLCAEGRFELALDAIRGLDVDELLSEPRTESRKRRQPSSPPSHLP
jgi:hypothetical protein